MSYLPADPTLPRQPELYQPMPFNTTVVRSEPAPQPDTWSVNAFGYTVLFLGGIAVTLMAWGAYSALPGPANAEKRLQAAQSFPKLKMEMRPDEPPLAQPIATESTQVAAMPPPPPPFEPGAPSPAPVKIEVPAPTEPLKIDLPPVPVPTPTPAPMMLDVPPIPAPSNLPPPPVAAPMPIAAVEAAAPVPPVQQEPTIFLERANLGETPMIRNWKTLALYSLLAAAPVAAPAPVIAAGGEQKKADADAANQSVEDQVKRLEGVLKKAIESMDAAAKRMEASKGHITKLQEDVAGLKTYKLTVDIDLEKATNRIEDLEKQLRNAQADVNFLKRELARQVPSANPALERAGIEELRKQLSSIEQAIRNLKPAESTSRVALSPPATTGKVVVTNLYDEELLFVINQKQHRVPPGAAVAMEVPAGSLVYEVISGRYGLVRPRTTANLPANETLTLTASFP